MKFPPNGLRLTAVTKRFLFQSCRNQCCDFYTSLHPEMNRDSQLHCSQYFAFFYYYYFTQIKLQIETLSVQYHAQIKV